MKYIEYFHLHSMWSKYDVCWDNIRPDVNILVGINGAGKTTFLNNIYDYYTKWIGSSHKLVVRATFDATDTNIPIEYIRSFDVPSSSKKNSSPLMAELNKVVYQNSERFSFFDYLMRPYHYDNETERVKKRIHDFFALINDFFVETNKEINFERDLNKLVFYDKQQNIISLEMLSAGEKQLLLILLSVFLMDEKPSVLLMDEPELSLHIAWQEKLISALRKLNPNCQIILTTHSPSIFALGWENNLTFMEELYKPLRDA